MVATRLRVFVSSVQPEFADVRRNLKAFLLGDVWLRKFISEVFLFEELPARDQTAAQAYLEEVERCEVYLAILGQEYGSPDEEGVSATEREYDHATKHRKARFVYVWGSDDKARAPGMQRLVRRASKDLIRRRILDRAPSGPRCQPVSLTTWTAPASCGSPLSTLRRVLGRAWGISRGSGWSGSWKGLAESEGSPWP